MSSPQTKTDFLSKAAYKQRTPQKLTKHQSKKTPNIQPTNQATLKAYDKNNPQICVTLTGHIPLRRYGEPQETAYYYLSTLSLRVVHNNASELGF